MQFNDRKSARLRIQRDFSLDRVVCFAADGFPVPAPRFTWPKGHERDVLYRRLRNICRASHERPLRKVERQEFMATAYRYLRAYASRSAGQQVTWHGAHVGASLLAEAVGIEPAPPARSHDPDRARFVRVLRSRKRFAATHV